MKTTPALKFICFPFVLLFSLAAAVVWIIGTLFFAAMAVPFAIIGSLQRLYNGEKP